VEGKGYPRWVPTDIIVASGSRRTPAMLQANREARDEGMRIYIMAKFDIRQFFGEERWVYYNPDADIVYFRTLRSTHYMMSRLFETGLAIPRVEVEIPNPDYWDRPS
jgi:hypothetical protein